MILIEALRHLLTPSGPPIKAGKGYAHGVTPMAPTRVNVASIPGPRAWNTTLVAASFPAY
jgi:hypothetical protein